MTNYEKGLLVGTFFGFLFWVILLIVAVIDINGILLSLN